MIRRVLFAAMATAALLAGPARAEDTIVWWDFLGGGDGVRMKALIEDSTPNTPARSRSRRRRWNGARRSTPRCRPRPPSAKAPTS